MSDRSERQQTTGARALELAGDKKLLVRHALFRATKNMEVCAVDRDRCEPRAHNVPLTHTIYPPRTPQTRSKTVFGENAGAGAAGKAKATTSGRAFGTHLSTNQQQVGHRGADMMMKKSTGSP